MVNQISNINLDALKEINDSYINASKRRKNQKNTDPHGYFYSKGSERIIGSKGRIFALVYLCSVIEKETYGKRTKLLKNLQKTYRYKDDLPQGQRAPYQWLHIPITGHPVRNDDMTKFKVYEYAFSVSHPLHLLGIDDVRVKEIEHVLLKNYAKHSFPEYQEKEIMESLRATLYDPHSSLKMAIISLVEKIDTLRKSIPTSSLIDQSLAGVSYSEDSGSLDDKTRNNIDKLCSYLKKREPNQIICISGSAYSGRTSLLRTALSRFDITLDGRENQGLRIERNSDDKSLHILPICAFNCHQKTYV